MFTTKELEWAAKVSNYMMELDKQCTDQARRAKANTCIPFGDLAYGKALADWNSNGRPKAAFFSSAEGEMECPFLMEFRKELTERFGLPILTREEAQLELTKYPNVRTVAVKDWGLN